MDLEVIVSPHCSHGDDFLQHGPAKKEALLHRSDPRIHDLFETEPDRICKDPVLSTRDVDGPHLRRIADLPLGKWVEISSRTH